MDKENDRLHEARFLSLVLSLHGSAWMAMGKVANPMTGKVERDLEAARGSIDLLETLRAKTQGNLTREEEKMLANALSVLQINFVDEVARGEGGEEKSQIPNPKSQGEKSEGSKSQIPNPKSQGEKSEGSKSQIPNPKSQGDESRGEKSQIPNPKSQGDESRGDESRGDKSQIPNPKSQGDESREEKSQIPNPKSQKMESQAPEPKSHNENGGAGGD